MRQAWPFNMSLCALFLPLAILKQDETKDVSEKSKIKNDYA